MSEPAVLFGYPISHYCVSAERMLAFKKVPFRRVHVPYHDKRELIRETGQDYVPAVKWGKTVVTWKDIPDDLERRVPEPTLYPPGQEALARSMENWAHQVIEEQVWRFVVTRVPQVLTDDVERWVFEELQRRSRGPWTVLQSRRPEFRRELHEYLEMLEQLFHDRTFILGGPSLADCGLFGALAPLGVVGEGIPRKFPRLRRWHHTVESW